MRASSAIPPKAIESLQYYRSRAKGAQKALDCRVSALYLGGRTRDQSREVE